MLVARNVSPHIKKNTKQPNKKSTSPKTQTKNLKQTKKNPTQNKTKKQQTLSGGIKDLTFNKWKLLGRI